MCAPPISIPPELQVLRHLQATCALMRRTADISLAKAVLAEEERLLRRIERLEAGLTLAAVQEPEVVAL